MVSADAARTLVDDDDDDDDDQFDIGDIDYSKKVFIWKNYQVYLEEY